MATKGDEAEAKAGAGTSADYYYDSYSHFGIHEEMLKDRVRTESYRRALRGDVVAGKVVVDVGCGTGILCLFAAAAGARHCYGIECSRIAGHARATVAASAYADRITIVEGRAEEAELPEGADVVVSEWMGYGLLYEAMLESVLAVRDRWLRPGGVVLPDRCDLCVCGIEDAAYRAEKLGFWDCVYGFAMPTIAAAALSEPLVDVAGAEQVATTSAALKAFDLGAMGRSDAELFLPPTAFALTATRDDTLHALVVYFDVAFGPSGVAFSTAPWAEYTHWKQTIVYLPEALPLAAGDTVTGTLAMTPNARNRRDLDIALTYSLAGKYLSTSASHTYFMH